MPTNNGDTNHDWIDVSVPLREEMVVWPGDIKLQIERRRSMERGDKGNNSRIHIGVHTGTHLDAPRHVIANGETIDHMPLDAAIGPARVIEIKDNEAIRPEELTPYHIKRDDRILFKTSNSPRCWQTDNFVADFVYIAGDTARLLADLGVRLVGIDYLSVGGPMETHQILLEAGIWLLEGLDLSNVSAGNHDLICLPLKLVQTEGSPVRAVLRPI